MCFFFWREETKGRGVRQDEYLVGLDLREASEEAVLQESLRDRALVWQSVYSLLNEIERFGVCDEGLRE